MISTPLSQDVAWDRFIQEHGLLVAETDGQIMGFGGIDVLAAEQVKWIYLLPEYQRAGIGSEILRRLEQLGWDAGLNSLRLHSAPEAVEFYRKHGYREVNARDKLGHDHAGVEMIRDRH